MTKQNQFDRPDVKEALAKLKNARFLGATITPAHPAQHYKNYPSPVLLAERLELVDGILHWKEVTTKAFVAGVQPARERRPATSSNQLLFNGKVYSTAAITWMVANKITPRYPVRHRTNSDGACNNIRNLVEVVQSDRKRYKPYVEYVLDRGFILARIIPSPVGSSRQREVVQKHFASISEAGAWAESALAGAVGDVHSTDHNKHRPPIDRKPRPFLSLPTLQHSPALPDLREMKIYEGRTAELPPFNLNALDMLSFRACERFVGEALNFCQQFPDRSNPTLTVALGAVDGAWRMSVTLDTPEGPHALSRASQEACLVPYAVEASVPLKKTPGRTPLNLRLALRERYRKDPPTQETRRRAISMLTSARIAPLSQDLRKKQLDIILAPDSESCDTPMPLFLMGLCHNLDISAYVVSRSFQGPATGLLVTVTRTRAGFSIRLTGWPKNDKAVTKPQRVASAVYPAKTSQARYEKIRKKVIYTGTLANLDGIMRLSPLISEAITNRLNQEKATPKQLQTKGVKGSLFVFIDGVKMTLPEALKRHGNVVPYHVARARLNRRWDAKEAVTRATKTPGMPQPGP